MEKVECEVEAFKRFKFELGAEVATKQDLMNARSWTKEPGWRELALVPKILIVARSLEEDCTGSMMRIYSVRMYAKEGIAGIARLQELELCEIPVPVPETK